MATKAAKKTNRKPGIRYIVDAKGKKVEVLLPISLYRRLVEQAQELQDIRASDKAVKKPASIPWEDAKKRLGL
jgi:hypothetical protein